MLTSLLRRPWPSLWRCSQEKIVHKVLVPQMLDLWFRNREDGGVFLSASQAYHRGMPANQEYSAAWQLQTGSV